MEKYRYISLIIATTSLFVTSCSKENKKTTPTMDDVTFVDDNSQDDPKPRDVTLPSVGSDAVAPLEINQTVSYFNNVDLHTFVGQWSGYGIHYPSIVKFDGTYYLYSSTPDSNVGIKAYSSTDLVSWNFVGSMGYVTKEKTSFLL